MPWTSLQGKKPTARHLFRNSPIEKNDFSYYFLLLLLLASKNLSALTRSPLLSAGVGGYMVTFTINIPPMLAYIYIPAPWILWVISHQLLMKIAIFPAWIADHQWLSLFLLQRIKIFSQFSMQLSVVLCGFICYFPWKKRHDDPTRFAAQKRRLVYQSWNKLCTMHQMREVTYNMQASWCVCGENRQLMAFFCITHQTLAWVPSSTT